MRNMPSGVDFHIVSRKWEVTVMRQSILLKINFITPNFRRICQIPWNNNNDYETNSYETNFKSGDDTSDLEKRKYISQSNNKLNNMKTDMIRIFHTKILCFFFFLYVCVCVENAYIDTLSSQKWTISFSMS